MGKWFHYYCFIADGKQSVLNAEKNLYNDFRRTVLSAFQQGSLKEFLEEVWKGIILSLF